MILAVPYEDGKVVQHLCHARKFKIYEVENGAIVSQKLLDTDGRGKDSFTELLSGENVEILIYDDLGSCAPEYFIRSGIRLCEGADGNTDEIVEEFLDEIFGELEEGNGCCGRGMNGCCGNGNGSCGNGGCRKNGRRMNGCCGRGNGGCGNGGCRKNGRGMNGCCGRGMNDCCQNDEGGCKSGCGMNGCCKNED